MVLIENTHLRINYEVASKAIVITATHKFIPGEAFVAAFTELLEKLPSLSASRMIFDKRQLSVFDQKAMTWYHVSWKPLAYDLGIRQHIKLLPSDAVFRKSVEIGKQRIIREHPDFDYDKYAISYSESLEEALNMPLQA